MEELDDDPPALSAHALAALREFMREQNEGVNGEEAEEVVELVKEDWRLSQFWYDRDTAETLVQEVRCLVKTEPEAPRAEVACLACPTLYAYLKKMDDGISAKILEFDRRFEQYGDDFVFYDYNQPEELPLEMKHSYRIIVADPPYLSKECLEKVAKTISFLANPKESFLLLLTGAVQKERALELLNVRSCGFRPCHTNKLGNEFLVFTNYDPQDRLGGWDSSI